MKKLLSLLLALLLVCVAPAMAVESVAGTWVLEGGLVDGTFINASVLGLNMTYTLNADGTIVNHLVAEGIDALETGVWTQDGYSVSITIEGNDPSPAQLQDEALAVYDKATGIVLRFVRAESQFTPGQVRTDAALADFLGAWGSFTAVHEGMRSDITSLQLVIAENVVVLSETADGKTTNLVLDAAYANGTITAKADLSITATLAMVDNPALRLTLSGVDYYFRPVESVAAPSITGMWHLQSYRFGTKTYTPDGSYSLLDFQADGSALYESTADGVTLRRMFSWKQIGPLVTISGSGHDGFDTTYFIAEDDTVTMVNGDMPWTFGREALMTGMWYMDKGYTNQGEEFNCAEHGSFMTMALNQDGTFRIEMPDPFTPVIYTGTWTQEDDKIVVVLSNGVEQEFDISADCRTLMYNGDDAFSLTRKIPLTGEWHMNYITVGDELIDPFGRGLYATFTLSSNGTAHADALIYGGEEPTTGTWTQNNGDIAISWTEGLTMPVEIKNGELLITDPDDGLVFHCTRNELLYADRIGATLEDYQGTWQMTNLSGYGNLYSASDISIRYSIVVSGSTAELIMVTDTETKTLTVGAAVESGKLLLTDGSSTMPMQLRGDGYALMPIGDNEIRYFQKVE